MDTGATALTPNVSASSSQTVATAPSEVLPGVSLGSRADASPLAKKPGRRRISSPDESKHGECVVSQGSKQVLIEKVLLSTKVMMKHEENTTSAGESPRAVSPIISSDTKFLVSPATAPIKISRFLPHEPTQQGDENALTSRLEKKAFSDRTPATGESPREVSPSLSSKTELLASPARATNKISRFLPPGPTQPGAESAKTGLLAKTLLSDRNLATGGP